MDKRRKYFLVLDVETAGSLGCPLVYDLGFAIVDKQGRVYEERSFVIKEIFKNGDLMKSAYYAEKIPKYEQDLFEERRDMASFLEAREEMFNLMRKYNVKTICAYNLAFDRRALGKTMETLFGKGKKFLTSEFKEVEQLCIWSFACEVIFTQKSYQAFAERHALFTEKGNMLTNAEVAYRYITGQVDFEESHTGLEDVKIEAEIMAKCFAQHKKHDSGVIAHPWRIPNKK